MFNRNARVASQINNIPADTPYVHEKPNLDDYMEHSLIKAEKIRALVKSCYTIYCVYMLKLIYAFSTVGEW